MLIKLHILTPWFDTDSIDTSNRNLDQIPVLDYGQPSIIWIYDSETDKNICTPSNNSPSRMLESYSENSTYLSIAIFSLIIISGVINAVTACATKSSYQSVFSSFNFCQLIMLIPLTGVYASSKVVEIFDAMDPVLLSAYHYKCDDFSVSQSLLEECGYSQTNPVLNFIGLESGSTVINIYIILLLFIILVMFHLILAPIYCCVKNGDGWCAKATTWFIEGMSFTVYIRLILEAYILFMLASVSEIERMNKSSGMQFRSFITAIALAVLCLAFLTLWIIHWIKYGTSPYVTESKFRTFYSGLKDTKLCRFFNNMFMIRRIIFVTLLIMLYENDKMIRLYWLTGVQLLYVVYMLILRPFTTTKDNVLELINEIGYLLICGAFIYFNKESRWTNTISWVFWSAIIGILVIFLFFSIGSEKLV